MTATRIQRHLPEEYWTGNQVAEHLGITRQAVHAMARIGERLLPFRTINGHPYYLRAEVIDLPDPRLSYRGRLGRDKVTGRGGWVESPMPSAAMTVSEAAKLLGVSQTFVRHHFGRYGSSLWVRQADVEAYDPPVYVRPVATARAIPPPRPRRKPTPQRDMTAEGFITVTDAARMLWRTRANVMELFQVHYASRGSARAWVKLTDVQAYRPPPPPVLPVGASASDLLAAARARRARKG